jgi:hypothetical protein
MVYELTVDYVTSTTVLVEADDYLKAVDAFYERIHHDKAFLEHMFLAEMENAPFHWSAFEVADAAAAPQVDPRDAEIRKEG